MRGRVAFSFSLNIAKGTLSLEIKRNVNVLKELILVEVVDERKWISVINLLQLSKDSGRGVLTNESVRNGEMLTSR
ncbi:MAG: hypothetical protein ACEY26_00675 [Candidatus Hodgkinia cicadicola]